MGQCGVHCNSPHHELTEGKMAMESGGWGSCPRVGVGSLDYQQHPVHSLQRSGLRGRVPPRQRSNPCGLCGSLGYCCWELWWAVAVRLQKETLVACGFSPPHENLDEDFSLLLLTLHCTDFSPQWWRWAVRGVSRRGRYFLSGPWLEAQCDSRAVTNRSRCASPAAVRLSFCPG